MTRPQATRSITVILMGVTGVGKSSVMAPLAERLRAVAAEGDDFHSAANIRKMRAGIPLDDDDRWPWLRSIAEWIGEREHESVDAVVTCSALRRPYRDVLREGHPSVRVVHLLAPQAIVERRLAARTGHYMPASLLPSQLETLEPLGADEPGFELVTDRAPADLADAIVARLGRVSGPPP
jgi:gluconokinase